MEYEKKYNALVGQIKKAYLNAQTDSTKAVLEDILPSLKESEDEKIREALVKFHGSTIDIDGIKGSDIVAWLEKQGEQKLAWSEEDETNLTNTIIMLKEGASQHFTNSSIVPCVDWLKSLKERMKGV